MSQFLTIATVFVVAGWTASIFWVLWQAHRSAREARIALASGIAIAAWALAEIALAREGVFQGAPGAGVPPVGINLLVSSLAMALALAVSPSLRSLVSRQSGIIRLQAWRVAGVLLLIHLALGHVPLLFGLPAGVGDVLVGLTAFSVARTADTPQGRTRTLIWNLLGVLDLVVAVTLGVTTNPGPTQIFHTVPSSEMLTLFPLALIPVFAVPLSLTLHGVSLWQLLRGSWSVRSTHGTPLDRPTYGAVTA